MGKNIESTEEKKKNKILIVVNQIFDDLKNMSYPSRYVLLWLLELYFMTGAKFVLHRTGFSEGIFREIVLFVVASIPLIMFFFHINKFEPYQYKMSFYLFGGVLVIFLLTIIFHPEYWNYFTKPGYGLERVLRPDCAIYAFLFFSLLDNPDDILDVIKKYAILDFIFIIIMDLIPRIVNGWFYDIDYLGNMVHRPYSLSFGYAMIFPTLIFLYEYLEKKKILCLLSSVFGIITIVLYGNRGALLLVGIFIILMTISRIMESKNALQLLIRILIVLGIVAILLFFFGKPILTSVSEFLSKLGIQSRTIDLLLAGNIANGTGRDEIWTCVLEAIRQGGIFGYGVFGDRPFVEPVHYAGYSHNIFLELISNFGVLGIAIIILIIITSIRMLFLCKERKWRELFIIFFSISCQLLTSMSYWYVMEFWIAAAIAHKYFQISGKKVINIQRFKKKGLEHYER